MGLGALVPRLLASFVSLRLFPCFDDDPRKWLDVSNLTHDAASLMQAAQQRTVTL